MRDSTDEGADPHPACNAPLHLLRPKGAFQVIEAGTQLVDVAVTVRGRCAEELRDLLRALGFPTEHIGARYLAAVELSDARPSARRVFRSTVALDDAHSAEARRGFWETRVAVGSMIITRAVERGEIRPVADPIAVVEALVGTVYVRTFLLERPVTDEVVTRSAAARVAVKASKVTGEAPPQDIIDMAESIPIAATA